MRRNRKKPTINQFIMENGGDESRDNPYRETRSEWFYMRRSELLEILEKMNFKKIPIFFGGKHQKR